MRALLLVFTIACGTLPIVFYPYVGVLTWEWLNLMNPHRLASGSVVRFGFVEIVAVLTMGSWLFSKERKIPHATTAFGLILVFMGLIYLSQIFSLDPRESAQYTSRYLKVLLFALFVLVMTTNRLRMHAALWVFALSIGFFGVRGGAFTILTGGGYHVFGPPGSTIFNNNHLGTALVCILPLIFYLYQTLEDRRLRLILAAVGGLTFVAVLGTQSRGAFVALVALAGLMWLRSSKKVAFLAGFLILAIPALIMMPAEWSNRMSSIQDMEEDGSFMGRVDAWRINLSIASSRPLTGGGLRVPYKQTIADRYTGGTLEARAAHSIYFEIIGGMGFIAFIVFMTLVGIALFRLQRMRKTGRQDWVRNLATMLQASMVAILVGGLVQSIEMWEGLWLMIVLAYSLDSINTMPDEKPELDKPQGFQPRFKNQRPRNQLRKF